jgi:hypothetical protein
MPAVVVSDYGGTAGQPVGASGHSPVKLVMGTWNPGVYATGGVTMTGLGAFFPRGVGAVFFMTHPTVDFVWSTTTVQAIVKATGVQVANGVDLSGAITFVAVGASV